MSLGGHPKCEFNVTETRFLGFIISTDGIRADPEKTRAVVVVFHWDLLPKFFDLGILCLCHSSFFKDLVDLMDGRDEIGCVLVLYMPVETDYSNNRNIDRTALQVIGVYNI